MAKKFLTQIDMNGLEVRNFLVHKLGTAPTAIEGKLYFNSTDHTLYYYNGTAWVALAEGVAVYPATANPVMDGTAAVGTSAKYAREDHVHPTDTSRAASSHAHGNITSGGDITATAPTIASGDQIIINDHSASKVTNGPTFDGSTTTKALTPKGTWETFATVNTDTKVTQTPVDNNVARPVVLAYDASYDELTNTVSKSSSFTYNASTKTLVTGGTINGYTLAEASEKSVDTSISSGSTSTNLPTTAAVASFVSTQIGAADAMRFKGTIGTGGDVTSLPTSGVKVGDTYRVITAGTYAGQTCEVGDLIIAIATTPTWTVAQTNIDGAITTAGTGLSKSGTTLNHSNSVTAKTTQALYPIKFDAQGHITGAGTAITNATTTTAGLMSASDKSNLNAALKKTSEVISAGNTSVTSDIAFADVVSYTAKMNGEEVIVDFDADGNDNARFSIASAQTYGINIYIAYN